MHLEHSGSRALYCFGRCPQPLGPAPSFLNHRNGCFWIDLHSSSDLFLPPAFPLFRCVHVIPSGLLHLSCPSVPCRSDRDSPSGFHQGSEESGAVLPSVVQPFLEVELAERALGGEMACAFKSSTLAVARISFWLICSCRQHMYRSTLLFLGYKPGFWIAGRFGGVLGTLYVCR